MDKSVKVTAGGIILLAVTAQLAWWGFVAWCLWKLMHWLVTK